MKPAPRAELANQAIFWRFLKTAILGGGLRRGRSFDHIILIRQIIPQIRAICLHLPHYALAVQ